MVVLLIGPSGCGKSSVAKSLDYPKLVSTTTRKPREGEVNGVDYIFLSKSEFKSIEFAETTVYDGQLYGYQKQHITPCFDKDRVFVGVVDSVGVKALREILGTENVYVISIEAKASDLVRWMKKRGDSSDNIIKRLVKLNDSKEIVNNSIIADDVVNESNLQELINKIRILIEKKVN